jgi:hypothetical protein
VYGFWGGNPEKYGRNQINLPVFLLTEPGGHSQSMKKQAKKGSSL